MTPGLYVHVPFCSALCPYCDFAVVVGRADQHERYCDALVAEAGGAGEWPAFGSLFVGGGTPTALDARLLARTLDRLRGVLSIPRDIEATVEANPDSVDPGALRRLATAGINRVSIGAQSFADHVLRALGRTHDAASVALAVASARGAGFDNVNLDLIYGGPHESDQDWLDSLRAAIALGVEHVSCYALTIEERTPFGGAVARGTMPEPDPDMLADRYEVAADLLAAAGYEHYEVSNWAKPGRECAHNLATWRQGDYLGLGLGSHSHRGGRRWWNTRALPRYLADPANAVDGEEVLSDRERADEWLSLRIRLAEGVDLAEAAAVLGRDPGPAAHELARAGLCRVGGGRLRLTRRGMLLENQVTAHLLDRPLALSTLDC